MNSKMLFCTEQKYWYYSKGQNTARVYHISTQSSVCRKFSSFEEQFTLVICKWKLLIGITHSLLEEEDFLLCRLSAAAGATLRLCCNTMGSHPSSTTVS